MLVPKWFSWLETSNPPLPQVAETNTPQTQDAPGEFVLYDEYMTRVYIADALTEERSALRLMLLDLNMEVVEKPLTGRLRWRKPPYVIQICC